MPVHRNPPPQDSVVAYLPFILPLWGFAQQSQGTNNLVINTHMNFVRPSLYFLRMNSLRRCRSSTSTRASLSARPPTQVWKTKSYKKENINAESLALVRDRFIILNENGGVLMLHGPTK